MTGIPQFNFPEFKRAAELLRRQGYSIVSPAELDDPSARAAALYSPDGDADTYHETTGETWGDFLSRDVKLIADEVDAVIVLEGWEKSRGARLEVYVARTQDKPIYSYAAWGQSSMGTGLTPAHRVSEAEIAEAFADILGRPKATDSAASQGAGPKFEDSPYKRAHAMAVAVGGELPDPPPGEVRITSETGGQKGQKPERMDLIPPEFLLELSRVYGEGAKKYSDHNYLKGYDWSLSYGAMLRHIAAWSGGTEIDSETGCEHLAHAAWHCATLFMFARHNLGTDDRLFHAIGGDGDE